MIAQRSMRPSIARVRYWDAAIVFVTQKCTDLARPDTSVDTAAAEESTATTTDTC